MRAYGEIKPYFLCFFARELAGLRITPIIILLRYVNFFSYVSLVKARGRDKGDPRG